MKSIHYLELKVALAHQIAQDMEYTTILVATTLPKAQIWKNGGHHLPGIKRVVEVKDTTEEEFWKQRTSPVGPKCYFAPRHIGARLRTQRR